MNGREEEHSSRVGWLEGLVFLAASQRSLPMLDQMLDVRVDVDVLLRLWIVPASNVHDHDGFRALQFNETVDADAAASDGVLGGLPVLGQGEGGGLKGGEHTGRHLDLAFGGFAEEAIKVER